MQIKSIQFNSFIGENGWNWGKKRQVKSASVEFNQFNSIELNHTELKFNSGKLINWRNGWNLEEKRQVKSASVEFNQVNSIKLNHAELKLIFNWHFKIN